MRARLLLLIRVFNKLQNETKLYIQIDSQCLYIYINLKISDMLFGSIN